MIQWQMFKLEKLIQLAYFFKQTLRIDDMGYGNI